MHIAVMHEPGPDRETGHQREPMLHIDSQQDEKRHKEMAENDDLADPKPSVPLAGTRTNLAQDVPERFFGDIGVPDDEILSKGDVGVKYREREQQ